MDENLYPLLMDYAAGTLSEGVRLAIATHLALNNHSRVLVAELAEAAGAALNELPPSQLPDTLKARSFASLQDSNQKYMETERCTVSEAANDLAPIFPAPLRAYLQPGADDLDWQRVTRGIERYVLPIKDTATVQLMRIEPGRKIPAHRHSGLELAVILEGQMHEGKQHWQRGDIAIADAHTHHRPYTNGQSCLCLLVTEGNLRFTGPLGRFYNRLAKF